MIGVFWVPFLRPWWWLFAPVFLSIELKQLYFWWINWDYFYAKIKWVTLEIIPPKEILLPLKAMEDVFTILYGTLLTPPNWREEWFEGIMAENPDWMSWEIASIEGKLHFYVRLNASHRGVVETALYSHYPEIEIREASDYTKDVPQNIPNEEWDTYGEDFVLGKPAYYPINTYEKFFEPQGEKMQSEDKRMEPIGSLLELMSRLGVGEQFWLQFVITSLTEDQNAGWKKAGQKAIAKMLGRSVKTEKTLWEELLDVIYNLVMGPKKEGSGDKVTYSWPEPMKVESEEKQKSLTGGEKDIVSEIENKIKKPSFRTIIRGVYVAKRENWNSGHRILTRAYFGHFHTQHLNYISFSKATRPKTTYIFRKKIPFLRTRRMFRNFILRFPPLFPNREKETATLSTEELTTIFHFPLKITGLVLPTMGRVESKKGGPPPNLPV